MDGIFRKDGRSANPKNPFQIKSSRQRKATEEMERAISNLIRI
jgi:hypothetical protein